MTEPLRRSVRARLLRGLSAASAGPTEPLVRGALSAAAAGARFSRAQGVILANLERALGDELDPPGRRRLARRVRHHAARQLREWARLARGPSEAGWLASTVRVDPSIAILERELSRGRGAIVVTAHVGNWELLAVTLRRRGLDGAVVGRRRPRDSSSDWLVDMRAAWDVATLPQSSPPRELLRVLERGGTLGLLPDLEVRRLAGAFLPFFGLPALTMTAPAALARARGLPLVPVRCVLPRDARGTYTLSVDEPLHARAELGRHEAKLELTTRLGACFERWIRETPEQWAWHQQRWRTRPGELTPVPYAARLADARAARPERPGRPERASGAREVARRG